jgi:hypothetical protein
MAPATEGSHYALAYIRAAGVGDSSEVLVYGATGAIGSAAVATLWRSSVLDCGRPGWPPSSARIAACSS